MTRDEFLKYKFKAYQELIIKYPRTGQEIYCMLLSVCWDLGTFEVQIFDERYETTQLWVHHDICEIPYGKLKVKK